jgi:hypothetical protein
MSSIQDLQFSACFVALKYLDDALSDHLFLSAGKGRLKPPAKEQDMRRQR